MMISSALRSFLKHLGSRQILSTLVMLASMLMLSGCGESYSWNQKLTIEVDTPNGVVFGSAVTHVKIVMKAGLLDAWDGDGSFVTGEANVVDLGDGKYLFSLVNNAGSLGSTTHWAYYATSIDERKTWPLVGPMIQNANIPYVLEGDNQPMLVTFDDINDPTTVKQVNPNNLAASFGVGYSLKSMRLEITNEKVTHGELEKALVWIYSEKILTNPVWKNLPQFTKKVIRGLRQPGGVRK